MAATTSTTDAATLRRQFADLHRAGTFVMPNPWDAGSSRLLATLGFPALATTSSGFAATLGRHDQHVTLDELVAHVAAICAAVELPVNVDAERCFADDASGIAPVIEQLADVGAAGISIEDFDPATGAIDDVARAVERVAAAAAVTASHGITLTARAENFLYGITDLDDTIARLVAYREAGADALYAPGLSSPDDIRRVVDEVGGPVNVLLLPSTPTVPELTELGVRRVSTGGALAWAAYGGLMRAARELADHGTSGYFADAVPGSDRTAAFGPAHS